MERTCNLDTLIRDDVAKRRPLEMDDDMGVALRAAVEATRAKIDEAFAHRVKFAARFKDA